MFMKVCHFKVQGSIALNSSIPEANEQYVMFFLKKQLLLVIRDSHKKQKMLYVFSCVACFHFHHLHFDFKRSFLSSLLNSYD